MKIKKIKKLKNLGIFSDFNAASDLFEFSKFNLFYGWNGSGKTTLSKLFYSLQNKKELSEDLKLSEFKIQIDGNNFTQIDSIELANLKVFNEDFIKENIDWDNKIKSILLISEEKIIEKEKLENIQKDQKRKQKEFDKKDIQIKTYKENIQKELSKKAKEIKTSFQTISPEDRTYFNYNKTKIESFLVKNNLLIKENNGILSEDELLELIESIKPNEKQIINFKIKEFISFSLEEAEVKILDLLRVSLTSGVIERLKNNSDISEWIEAGLEIHEKHGNKNCEFCGNSIDAKRFNNFKKHFSDELTQLREKFIKAKEWIKESLIFDESIELNKELFYKDLQSNLLEKKKNLESEIKIINKFFIKWTELLEDKIQNPSKEIIFEGRLSKTFLENYKIKKQELEDLIKFHNNRVENFDSELQKNQQKLELHYATEFKNDFQYFRKLEDIKKLELENKQLKIELDSINKEIFDLNSDLSNEELGADEFNKTLAKFIGHNEIKLKFNKNLQGYEIIRTYHNIQAKNLSEGEKTAIAFIFFITKLKEKNNLENEIIILDDPVSSFDSNNLFSAYSFIKSELENVKQLIILTHNFTFFRLIRDWFQGKNKNNNRKSEFFQIEILPRVPRESIIKNIDSTLLDYNSEYHFIFSKLHAFKNDSVLNLEKSFQAANLSRKLLESFLSFKFPQKRNNFRQLLQSAIKDTQKEEKIYKFISKYSHLPMDYYENAENNLIGETDNITKEIFDVIENIDKNHYDEMVIISKI